MCGIREYENLAQAIILLAVKDYRAAKRQLQKDPRNAQAARINREVRRFFLSEYFRRLTKLDGRLLLAQLDEED